MIEDKKTNKAAELSDDELEGVSGGGEIQFYDEERDLYVLDRVNQRCPMCKNWEAVELLPSAGVIFAECTVCGWKGRVTTQARYNELYPNG